MEREKNLLPLVVPSSSGVGGVSARVSVIMPEEVVAERVSVLEETDSDYHRRPRAERRAGNGGLEQRAGGSAGLPKTAIYPGNILGEALLEASRANFEQALQLFHDLVS